MQWDLQARMSMQKTGHQSNFKLTNEQILLIKTSKQPITPSLKSKIEKTTTQNCESERTPDFVYVDTRAKPNFTSDR